MNSKGSDEIGWRESVYFLLDCSASMGAETLAEIQMDLQILQRAWARDHNLVQCLRISLITFDSHVRQVFPLTSILSESITSKLEIPFIAQGTSSLGAALLFLNETINREVKKTKQNSKGDYVPYTFIITDAQPTDQWQESLTYFVKRNHRPFFLIPFHTEETNSIALKIYYSSLFVTERNRDKFPPNETCTKRSSLDYFWYEDELNDLDLSYFVFNFVKAIVTSKYLS